MHPLDGLIWMASFREWNQYAGFAGISWKECLPIGMSDFAATRPWGFAPEQRWQFCSCKYGY